MQEYAITETAPTAEQHLALRSSVGWRTRDAEFVRKGLAGSLYVVCIYSGEELIASARVVGDGYTAFYIQDVIVHPAHQGQGLGRAVMEKTMAYIAAHAGEAAVVGLMAAMGKEEFYKKFGFWSRPTEGYGPGMMQFWSKCE